MPLYRRSGSPFWWYNFTLDGLRFRGSTGKASKREAAAVEHDEKNRLRSLQATREDWRLRQVFGAYWEERGKHLRSWRTVEYQLGKLSDYLGKDLRVSRLTAGALMDYKARRRGDGLQPHTVNRELAVLRAAINHAHKIHAQPMPTSGIPWGDLQAKEPPHRIRFLSREEYDDLMAAAHESLRPIILCAITTGLRKDNILTLDWRQVKLEQRLILIKRTKGNRSHSVRIAPALMAALSTMPRREGRVFDLTNFRKRWDKAVTDAGLDDFRFHDLRHTFASWARMAGADLADLKEALDHTTLAMTVRYAHIKPDEHRTAFDRVSETILAQSASHSLEKRRKTADNAGD